MQIVKLKLKKRTYNIIIGSGIIKLLGKYISKLNIGYDAYVITNAPVKNKYGGLLLKALRESGFNVKFNIVAGTEKSKSFKELSLVVNDITLYDKKRQVFIVAFGGGVVGDLAGFAASIYKRGIPYIQVPTTLLAQVDSSIGGKTAVDLRQGKNLLGAFYQPALVLSDIKFLKSLSPRQLKSGLAEVIKYGIIKDPFLFGFLERQYREILQLKTSVLEFIIKRSSSIKAGIVEHDEREERGMRTILNFGHTIGHAIETAGSYRDYNHGEAISLGMLTACDISTRLNLLGTKTAQRIENLIKAVGLPVRIEKVSCDSIIEAHYRDKKFIGASNRFVLLRKLGQTKIVENVALKTIKEALKKRCALKPRLSIG